MRALTFAYSRAYCGITYHHRNTTVAGQFKLSGADNPGIVHKFTSVLARNNLTIGDMKIKDPLVDSLLNACLIYEAS